MAIQNITQLQNLLPVRQTSHQAVSSTTSSFADRLETANSGASKMSVATDTIPLLQPDLPMVSYSSTVTTYSVGTARLLSADAITPDASASSVRPTTAEFCAKTGVDSKTACSLLYGVVGANKDYRDWAAIMASDDPLADTRASTAAMYTSALPYTPTDAHKPTANSILAQVGPFAFIQESTKRPPQLALLDGEGNLLRYAGYNSTSIKKNIYDFGFNISDLKTLAAELDAKGIAYKPGDMKNFEVMGTDFNDLVKEVLEGGG